ncbi:MAG TPA: hypothetical protein VF721_20230 [Pyrinomonadaceae bacterium]|jgi:hypothetical protein
MKQIIAGVILILAFGGAAGFAQTNKNFCSEIKFAEEQSLLYAEKPAQIKVEVNEEFKKYKIKYLWTVSGGEITRGQGASGIELTPRPVDEGNNIFVTVKLDGLPENCLDTNTHTFAVACCSGHFSWFDQFGRLPKNDLYGRLDNFFVALRNDSGAEGLVVLEFGKAETRAKKIKRLNDILSHVKRRKFESRLKFLISEADEEYTKFLVIPQGADLKRVIFEDDLPKIIEGEDLERKIKELFPRK